MGYREDMEYCRNYIDEHLYEDIDPHTLSKMISYSHFHFCHVFRSSTGMAVLEYIRDRKLNLAAVKLTSGETVTETAFDCGFETISGFTRAFRRKFGITPNKYKKMKGGYMKMKPEIKKHEAFAAIGYIVKSEQELDIHENRAFWLGKDFSSVSKEDYAKLTYPGYAEVGAWIHSKENSDQLYYFLGPTVKNKSYVPKGMEILEVPEAEYAVFTVPKATSSEELHENVNKTWKYIFNDWFDGNGYAFDQSKIDFEYYIGEETYIYIPIMK